jgi:hypothetical protein
MVKWAENQGWFSFKVAKSNKRGVPDRFFARDDELFNGRRRVVLVEFKGPKELVKEQQQRRIKELRKAGVEAWVCRSEIDFKKRML